MWSELFRYKVGSDIDISHWNKVLGFYGFTIEDYSKRKLENRVKQSLELLNKTTILLF